ncbi:stage III sporulation protein AB [Hazenella sp. IB182353]|uniref:stage III sporulation protein SpoIIIAB n=1 Tax=Polycladospora coralii TaxID=2771432 RepID=UPI00174795AB|nr:stage III sporulation protein SpoIIIAB [Polycladospora coralii]MBS7530892.1 stage III sporulation protein AB [Polycladospora coralii]
MIKWIGAMLIFGSSTWIGLQQAKQLAKRPLEIRQLRTCLSLLETDISYGTKPLADACLDIASREDHLISTLFAEMSKYLSDLNGQSTFTCIQAAVDQVWPETVMGSTEKRILLDLAKVLGASDRENQLSHLTIAIKSLEAQEEHAKAEQLRYSKMYRTIGVLAGTLIILLMI